MSSEAESKWIASSQHAPDLYNTGAKLWTKSDLAEIERQLAETYTTERFMIRRIDGSKVEVENPMYRVRNPIWKPEIVFWEYWSLVLQKPEHPPGLQLRSYGVEWHNSSVKDFDGLLENARELFKKNKELWDSSQTCTLLELQIGKLLDTKKVTKIICFGLGNISRKPPFSWMVEDTESRAPKGETEDGTDSMIQHSVALTLADLVRRKSGSVVRLLAQDPDYSDLDVEMLKERGFEVVGRFGAGGFAEVDDETLVFSVYVTAPVKQILAEIARPAIIITHDCLEPLMENGDPLPDAHSPRTMRMWMEYEHSNFPFSPEENALHFRQLQRLGVLVNIGMDMATAAGLSDLVKSLDITQNGKVS